MDSILKPIGPLARVLDGLSNAESAVLLVALSTPESQRSEHQKKVVKAAQDLLIFLTEK